ncbi:MAG: helix-turn-helix transcriptional regulator [Candidatus Rokubacteria bacterium]|nr:helix-turn-helix transcriptional regulator [Candidatus Rokubacteria bacterium]
MGQRIRQLRQSEGLKQDELAQQSGISVSFISMIERGDRSPALETLCDLAEALGVPPHELLVPPDAARAPNDPMLKPIADLVRKRSLGRKQIALMVKIGEILFAK